MAIGTSPFVQEVVVPLQTSRGTERQRAHRIRIFAGVAAGCLLVATVAFSSGQGSGSAVLGAQDAAIGINVPQRYARLAKDEDNRSGLAAAFKSDEEKVKAADQQRKFHSVKALEKAKERLEEANKEHKAEHTARVLTNMEHEHEERTAVMVPWVHWPAQGARYAGRKQSLLEVSLAEDASAQVMPMKEIMDRLIVDHKLHSGQVSDTQLAMADSAQARRRDAAPAAAPAGALDCAPFC